MRIHYGWKSANISLLLRVRVQAIHINHCELYVTCEVT